FDLLRQFDKTKPIATFGGGGPHQCIGQFFAKLEVQILFEELLKRFPNISPAGPAERTDHFTILLSPIKHLPVQFKPVH
ncbi:MAG: cytochrome P450, partial [Caulobacterales bacterium]